MSLCVFSDCSSISMLKREIFNLLQQHVYHPSLSAPSPPTPFHSVPPQTVPDPNLNPVPEARMLLIRWIDMNILCRLVVGYFFFIHGSSIMRQFFFFNCESLTVPCVVFCAAVRWVLSVLVFIL